MKAIIGILAILALAATLSYAAQERKATEGVYTTAQSDRGAQVVEDFGCRNCHGGELEGGPEEEPPLVGQEFLTLWGGRKLDELAEKITMMPANAEPGYQVKPASAADAVAYLLRANGYPVGAAELPADPKALRLIELNLP